jgi:DNA-binding NarL/FixJ family response regulator
VLTAPTPIAEPVRHGRTIDVLLVDDHAVVRRGLRAYLDVLEDIRVVGEAADGAAARRALAAAAAGGHAPDVVLMDLVMPRCDGITATADIVRDHPGIRVVVLTSFGEAERVQAALRAGATGYLLKDAEPDEVARAIRVAARGEVHLGGRVARYLIRQVSAPRAGLAALTPRERDILALVATGCSNREIARELTLSERTVRTHVSNILAKLRLSSRTQAALTAIREGLVPPPGSE